MSYQPINFAEKFTKFSEQWSPRVIAEMTGSASADASTWQFKLSKLEGDFIWHQHDDSDETFLVMGGELQIEWADDDAHVFMTGPAAEVYSGRIELLESEELAGEELEG